MAYLGYDIIILTSLLSGIHSPEECATACSRHQGHIRCGAWTFNKGVHTQGSSCTLKMSRGPHTSNISTATSGYVPGVCDTKGDVR